jgi:hypothetical protein
LIFRHSRSAPQPSPFCKAVIVPKSFRTTYKNAECRSPRTGFSVRQHRHPDNPLISPSVPQAPASSLCATAAVSHRVLNCAGTPPRASRDARRHTSLRFCDGRNRSRPVR